MTLSTEFLADFKRFFVGNMSKIGKQYKKRSTGEVKWASGLIKDACKYDNGITTIDQALTAHLSKRITMGSYPYYQLNDIWCCYYSRTDIDNHDFSKPIEEIKKSTIDLSKRILEDYREYYKIEPNNSLRCFTGMGADVWTKFKKGTPLSRAWDLKIDMEKRLKEKFNIIVEIFPKQNTNTIGDFGNCCKLPLSINRKNGQFCEILDNFDLSKQGLGYEIPEWIPKFIEPSGTHPHAPALTRTEVFQPTEIKDECLEFFLKQILPCLRAIAEGKSITHNCEGDNGHQMNMKLFAALYYLGASDDIIIKAFSRQPDHNPEKCLKIIQKLKKSFKPKYATSVNLCKNIKERGFCLYDNCRKN